MKISPKVNDIGLTNQIKSWSSLFKFCKLQLSITTTNANAQISLAAMFSLVQNIIVQTRCLGSNSPTIAILFWWSSQIFWTGIISAKPDFSAGCGLVKMWLASRDKFAAYQYSKL